MIRTKADIEFHDDGNSYRPWLPAVNVKVRGDYRRVPLPLDEGTYDGVPVHTHSTFTHDWIESHLTEDEIEGWFGMACEHGWETIEGNAKELFGSSVKTYAAGRSSGWVVVQGLSPVDAWDAIDLNPWRKFAKQARAEADDIPRSMLDLIYYNVFLPAHDGMMEQVSGM